MASVNTGERRFRLLTPFEHQGTPWHRRPLWGFILASVATVVGTFLAFLGPSVVTLQLGPRRNLLPPWYLPVDLDNPPNEWLVVSIGWAVVLIGAGAAAIWLRALAGGWLPDIKRMAAFCIAMVVAASVVPPMTSADALMYAAYGRIQLIGMDPYTITPAELFRQQWDPIVRWSERPWQDTPSVYGPVLMWVMFFANRLGGSNMHDVTFIFQMLTMLGAIAAMLIMLRVCRGDRKLQGRVLVIAFGPPLIWAVVVGSHNEAIVCAIGALAFLWARNRPLAAGLAVGIAICGKATMGIFGLAFAWAYRREPRKLIAFLIGSGVPTILTYFFFYPQALELAVKNASYVAGQAWGRPLTAMLDPLLGAERVQSALSLVAWGFCIMVVWMLSRLLPWNAAPGIADGVDPRRDPLTIALRTTVTISFGWISTSLYSLPWYDFITVLPIAVVGASMLDWVIIWRIVVLNFTYVPGRVVIYGDAMRNWAVRGREIFGSFMSAAIIASIVLWWHRRSMERGSLTAGSVPDGFGPRVAPLPAGVNTDDADKQAAAKTSVRPASSWTRERRRVGVTEGETS